MDLNKRCLFEVVCALKLRLFIFTTVKDDKQMKFGAHCCSSYVLPHNVQEVMIVTNLMEIRSRC